MDIIFFDAGGTLLYPEPGVGAAYAAAARRRGLFDDAGELEEAFSRAFAEKRRESIVQSRGWWLDVVRRTFAAVGETRDVTAVFDEVYHSFCRPDGWRLFPGARETLIELRRRGYRTGVISNWDDRLPGVLEGLGLAEGLDPIVLSNEVGAEKPDPRIYRAAIDRAGIPTDRALMVGDDLEADHDGARAAGLAAILFAPRDGEPDVPFVRALPELLDRLP